jgi:hypothetical protein
MRGSKAYRTRIQHLRRVKLESLRLDAAREVFHGRAKPFEPFGPESATASPAPRGKR